MNMSKQIEREEIKMSTNTEKGTWQTITKELQVKMGRHFHLFFLESSKILIILFLRVWKIVI